MTARDDFNAKLAQVKARFLEGLPGRIAELTAAADALAAAPPPARPEAVKALIGHAHKLAGAAGTFGFAKIGEAAAALEAVGKPFVADGPVEAGLIESGRAPDAAALKDIARHVAAIKAIAATASGSAAAPAAAGPPAAERSPDTAAASAEIVLVDDDADQAARLAALLEHFGYRVAVLDSPAALRARKGPAPAAVIMDIMFGADLDAGTRAIENLREAGALTSPVLFLSARGDFEARLAAARAGADGYVTKPVDVLELVGVLERALARQAEEAIRVLVVDDDQDVAAHHADLLRAAGMTTAVVTDPRGVMGPLVQFRPDVLLMDINMPGASGWEVVSVLRQFGPDIAYLPVVFLTSQATPMRRVRSIRVGGDAFLAKPVDPAELVNTVGARGERGRELRGLFARLNASDERFRAIMGSASEAILSTNEAGLIVYGNEGAGRLFGLSTAVMIGRPIGDFVANWEAIAAAGGGVAVEVAAKRADGAILPLEISVARWRAMGRGFVSWIGRDIAARREAERRAQESDAYLRGVFNAAVDGIITIDERGVIESANVACARIFGHDTAEMIGRNVSMLMPEPYASDHDRYLNNYMTTGKAKIIGLGREVMGRKKDGGIFPLDLSVSEMKSTRGRRFIGVVRDITQRKEAESKLRASEERLHRSHVFANIGTWDWNIKTGELYWSERIAALFGHPAGELETSYENFLGAVHPDDRQRLTDAVNACVERNAEYDIEHRVVWPDGTVRWVHEKGDVIRDDKGLPAHMLGVIQDITPRKMAEDGMRIAMEDADKANRAKSEFLSSMSHELRTPLNAILGFGQLLQYNPKEPLKETQQSCVVHILKGGEHLLALINEVLDLARIEAGRVDMSIEDIPLAALFEDVRALIEPLAAKARIALDMPAPTADMTARADYTRTKQALINLMSNAVKYNFEGGRITVRAEQGPHGLIRVSVADTGPGIPTGKQAELFKPFNRLGAEVTEIEGTGIGLALTKKLVEMMDGRIGFTSEIGVGSTFWFDLPAAGGKAPAAAPAGTALAARAETLPDVRGTLLYVEDNPANLKLMEMIVARIPNLTMLTAHNAEMGLAIAADRKPDVVIMDINLPGMDGYAALKRLKADKATQKIPVVALSANATPHDIEKGEKAGFFRYLTKPVDVERLLKTVNEAMESAP